MNIDKVRLRADIASLADEAKATKTILRATWTRPMADEQKKLVRLRRRLTELHVLLAWSRGRKHVTKPIHDTWFTGRGWDESWHLVVAERAAKDYLSPVVEIDREATS